MAVPVLLVSVLINWLLLIWLSAGLLFISQPDSLMNVETNSPTKVVNKILYTGYALFTLGLGKMKLEGTYINKLRTQLIEKRISNDKCQLSKLLMNLSL